MALYPKYDPGTYHSREVFLLVTETKDLRIVWAHKQAQKYGVSREALLEKCGHTCACCGSNLNYGLGKNIIGDKLPENTPSVDHVIPKARGGIDDIDNYEIICNRCNTLKRDIEFAEIARLKKIVAYMENHEPPR